MDDGFKFFSYTLDFWAFFWLILFAVCSREIPHANADNDERVAVHSYNLASRGINPENPQHKSFLKIEKKGDVDVVFFGDSITSGWTDTAIWKKRYEPMKAVDFGIGGDQVGHVLWRVTEGHELDALRPKVVVVMIGTNNITTNSAEQIAEGIRELVGAIHIKAPAAKILLLGIFPREAQPGSWQRQKVESVNGLISNTRSAWPAVTYLDIGQRFLENDGTISKAIMPDALHLSERGYEIWADAMDETLKSMLTPPPTTTTQAYLPWSTGSCSQTIQTTCDISFCTSDVTVRNCGNLILTPNGSGR